MRELTQGEIQDIAGGFVGPHMFDGLFEGLAILFGLGVVAAFAVGAGSVVAYQHLARKHLF